MRLLVSLLLSYALLAFPLHAGGKKWIPWTTAAGGTPPALVASTSAGVGANGGTTGSIDTTGANLLVVTASFYDGVTANPTLTDSKSNTWTALTKAVVNGVACRIYYCYGGTVGSGHTFTFSDSSIYASVNVQAWSGLSASPFDVENGNTNTSSTTVTTGSATPSQSNVLVIVAVTTDGSSNTPMSLNDSFTVATEVTGSGGAYYGGGGGYRVLTAGGARNPTWTANASVTNLAAAIAVFKY